jgi:hypothetical protein
MKVLVLGAALAAATGANPVAVYHDAWSKLGETF